MRNEEVIGHTPLVGMVAEPPNRGISSLSSIGRLLFARIWQLIAFLFVALTLAVIYLNMATYYYTATMNVAPVQSSASSSKLGNFAGLAAIAGIPLPQDSASMAFVLYVEGLRSRVAAEALALDPVIMQTVFKDEWDPEQKRFVEPNGPLKPVIPFFKAALGMPNYAWHQPDAARLQAYLQTAIKVIQNPKTPVIMITYRHPDAAFASKMLSALNADVDDILRRRSLDRSTQSIAYLTQQLARVTLLEHREAVAVSLSDQEKQRMFASSSLPFAAEPFGGIVVSLRPTWPQPIIVLVVAFAAGAIAGVGWIIMRAQASVSYATRD